MIKIKVLPSARGMGVFNHSSRTLYAYWMKKLKRPLNSLVQTPFVLIKSSLYIVATKDISDEEIAQWQKSLDKVKASKEFKEITNKYSQ